MSFIPGVLIYTWALQRPCCLQGRVRKIAKQSFCPFEMLSYLFFVSRRRQTTGIVPFRVKTSIVNWFPLSWNLPWISGCNGNISARWFHNHVCKPLQPMQTCTAMQTYRNANVRAIWMLQIHQTHQNPQTQRHPPQMFDFCVIESQSLASPWLALCVALP